MSNNEPEQRRSLLVAARAWMSGARKHLLDRLIQVAVVLTLVGWITSVVSKQQFVDCLVRYEQESAQASQARAVAAERDRQLLDDVLLAADSADRQALRSALSRYTAGRVASDAERAANPVIDPELRCG